MYPQYKNDKFRKFKLNVYINIQKSESKLIKNFEEKYGGPEKTQLIWGDYDNKGKNIKNKEPIITKGLRNVFRRYGYKVYLINEFRTSITCNICKDETELFYKRKNKKFLVWGLLRCKNLKCIAETKKGIKCSRYFNRDANSCENMLTIIRELKKTGKRPEIFCRQINKPIQNNEKRVALKCDLLKPIIKKDIKIEKICIKKEKYIINEEIEDVPKKKKKIVLKK